MAAKGDVRQEGRVDLMGLACFDRESRVALRAAVVLVEWLGMDQQEAAAALGIRPGSVRARLSRAKADLRRMLEEEDA